MSWLSSFLRATERQWTATRFFYLALRIRARLGSCLVTDLGRRDVEGIVIGVGAPLQALDEWDLVRLRRFLAPPRHGLQDIRARPHLPPSSARGPAGVRDSYHRSDRTGWTLGGDIRGRNVCPTGHCSSRRHYSSGTSRPSEWCTRRGHCCRVNADTLAPLLPPLPVHAGARRRVRARQGPDTCPARPWPPGASPRLRRSVQGATVRGAHLIRSAGFDERRLARATIGPGRR